MKWTDAQTNRKLTSDLNENVSHHMASFREDCFKFQASSMNSCGEHCDENLLRTDTQLHGRTDRQTHKGKTVYPPLLRSRGIKKKGSSEIRSRDLSHVKQETYH